MQQVSRLLKGFAIFILIKIRVGQFCANLHWRLQSWGSSGWKHIFKVFVNKQIYKTTRALLCPSGRDFNNTDFFGDNNGHADIYVLSDSQAAIRTIGWKVLRSIAYRCHRHLNELTELYNVRIIWVLGHSDIPDNCRTNELARRGSTIRLSTEIAHCTCPFKNLWSAILDFVNSRWEASNTVKTAYKIWPRLNRRQIVDLLRVQSSTT